MKNIFENYIQSISSKFFPEETSEMGYRTDFEILIKGIFESINVRRIDHDARAEQGNKPDFVVLNHDSTGKNYHVMPVIVFPGWFAKPMPENLKKLIWILNPEALPSFISNEPKTIDESDIHLAAFHISRYIRMYN